MRFYISAAICMALTCAACSVESSSPGPESSSQHLKSLEVYLARAALFDAEFEQFKITGNKLFVECGKLKHGRQIPLLQELITLPPEIVTSLKSPSFKLSESNAVEPNGFDEPGKAENFADPGICTIKLDVDGNLTEIKTSLDQISGPTSRGSTQVKRLIEILRAQVAPLTSTHSLCNNADFYGLKGDAKPLL